MNIDNITKGECGRKAGEQRLVCTVDGKEIADFWWDNVPKEEAIANLNLLREAGNVAQECGLSPAQLLQQNKELREALEYIEEYTIGAAVKVARETLSKHPNK